MKFTPLLTKEEITENRIRFSERAELYRKKGLDFTKNRNLILEMAGPLSGNILEIGTGSGHTALVLTKAGYDIVSIDPDKDALKIAAMNLAGEMLLSKVEFYQMDGTALDFKDKFFKNVVVNNLFHHINKSIIEKMLSEINRVLDYEGKLILSDFNKGGMRIVGLVHKAEGRVHGESGANEEHVFPYFEKLGYKINRYNDQYHWIIIGEKRA